MRLRVEACGVCHSDAATVKGPFPIQWPRVPGHQAVGVSMSRAGTRGSRRESERASRVRPR
ncbi:alcohol dehydrogenase catalytic domain-containing protein [Bradyrhizobium sp. 18BD]